tara:strand:+ start:1664 stop:2104 length:441 start_codon:yes stop_codon:yes gene_type:complete
MKYIGYKKEDEAEKWARNRLGVKSAPDVFRALSSVKNNGEFACVILLTNFTKRNIDINIAAEGKTWATPKNTILMFNGLFKMVFDELKAVRATALIAESNQACINLVKHVGFVKEGVMRKAYEDNENMHIYSILENEYRQHDWCRS